MNRRSFLGFLGIATAAVAATVLPKHSSVVDLEEPMHMGFSDWDDGYDDGYSECRSMAPQPELLRD